MAVAAAEFDTNFSYGDARRQELAATAGTSASRIKLALVVLRHADDLRGAVLSGDMGLDAAYEEASRRKNDLESRERRQSLRERQIAELRTRAPDLLSRVELEGLTLSAAIDMANERDHERMRQARSATELLGTVLTALACHNQTPAERAADWLSKIEPALAPSVASATTQHLDDSIELLSIVVKSLKERMHGGA